MSNDIEVLDIQEELTESFEFFVSFVHKRLYNAEFRWSPYNKRIVKELDNVYNLKYSMFIINIPPRLGKTLLITYFSAFTQLKNPKTYNNYYSYSDLLVNRFYSNMEKIFKIPEISELVKYTYKRRKEDFSNEIGGGTLAMTTMGQVTGSGSGVKNDIDIFNGAIFLDDINKAQDSIVRLESANKAVKSAVLNRRNNHRVPIVVIQQRIHKFDITGFLLDIYSQNFKDGISYLLKMPVLKEVNGKLKTISSIEYPLEQVLIEKEKDPDYFNTQLMQEPSLSDGVYFKNSIFDINKNISTNDKNIVTISFNPETINEPTVLIAFRKDKNKNIVISDYKEIKIDVGTFFNLLKEFCIVSNARKIYIPESLISKSLIQELNPLKVENIEESNNLKLSAFYSVEMLKGNKIVLESEALAEELKLFPNAKREYTAKAVINAIEILFLKDRNNRIKSSL
jgi:hypothetical protein